MELKARAMFKYHLGRCDCALELACDRARVSFTFSLRLLPAGRRQCCR